MVRPSSLSTALSLSLGSLVFALAAADPAVDEQTDEDANAMKVSLLQVQRIADLRERKAEILKELEDMDKRTGDQKYVSQCSYCADGYSCTYGGRPVQCPHDKPYMYREGNGQCFQSVTQCEQQGMASGGSGGYYPAPSPSGGQGGYYPSPYPSPSGGSGGYYPGPSPSGGQGYNPGTSGGSGGYYPSPAPRPSSKCYTDTKGTCAWSSCDKSRGDKNAVECKSSKCLCKKGYCVQKGKCVSQYNSGQCVATTGGTCSMLGCSNSRGGNAAVECKSGKCLCKFGYCNQNGKCVKSSSNVW